MFNEISNDFPGCAGTVTWQELELAANVNSNETYTDIYLVCGGTASEPEDPEECQPPRGNSYTESCPDGQEGQIVFTWQGSPVCSYTESNTCQAKVCENEPIVKTRITLCSDVLGEGYTGRIVENWDSETCSWKETSRECKYEQQKKRYLSHPYKCERLCARSNGAAGIQPCSAPSNKPLMPARCALLGIMREYLYNDRHYGIGLPAGCSAGKECPSCEVGKSYVNLNEVWCSSLGYDGDYGNSSFYSMEILQCMESTTPPGAGNLDCSNFRSPGGGGEIIIPNPGR